MPANIQYDSSTAHDTIQKLRADIDACLGTEVINRYDAILKTVQKSQGDFVESLKTEITEELMSITAVREFLTTLLDCMEESANRLDETEQSYSAKKVE